MPGKGGRFLVGIGTGSSNLWRCSGVDGGDGVFTSVGESDAVTPVARDTLLGAWKISSSSM